MPLFLRKLRYRLRSSKKRSHRPYTSVAVYSWVTAVCILCGCFLGLRHMEQRLGPLAQEAAVSAFNAAVVKESNQCIQHVLTEQNFDAGSLIQIQKNESGAISSMSTDYSIVNQLKSALSLRLQTQLENMGAVRTSLPMGTLFSNTLYTGLGPKLPLRIFAVNTLEVTFYDEFISAGINQTRYKLMAEIVVPAQIAGILTRQDTSVTVQLPLADSIVIGDVPQQYFHVTKE